MDVDDEGRYSVPESQVFDSILVRSVFIFFL
jgi:hypothetical protein